MNQAIIFLFSILLIMTGVYILYDKFTAYSQEEELAAIKEGLSGFIININHYCKDPFISNTFEFEYRSGQRIEYDGREFCTFLRGDMVMCERTDCEVEGGGVMFEELNITTEYTCFMEKTGEMIAIDCR